MLKYLEKFFKYKDAETVDEADAWSFMEYLRANVSERSVKDYIILVQFCWVWVEETVSVNPWQGVLRQAKPAPQQKAKPFTVDEVQRILEGFRCDRHHKHYADFVTFLFGTGCRLGEVAALKWKHFPNDFSTVWIGESVSRGVRKTTKTDKDRTVILTGAIAEMLSARKTKDCQPEDLVFPAPQEEEINDRGFRRRA